MFDNIRLCSVDVAWGCLIVRYFLYVHKKTCSPLSPIDRKRGEGEEGGWGGMSKTQPGKSSMRLRTTLMLSITMLLNVCVENSDI